MAAFLKAPVSHGLRGLIRAYQLFLSPLIGPRCRFTPSCSTYAAEAIELHGSARGLYLALYRVARCHPWGGLGYDPVPQPTGARKHSHYGAPQ
ncbi:MAG: membrane protein insertion efficiency factor YidD [Alphaproteobacteria bacterium]|nr:membrane protein insertion efficiency factor YidD [Alphaproteobacteria bacterium]